MDFCSIASGSSGNCIYIGSDENSVLVDAGVSCRRITEGLKGIGRCLNDLTGILITHEHSDHIQGLGVLSRKAHIPIYGTAATLRQIRRYNPIGTVDPELFREIRPDEPFWLGDLQATAFHISHDAADPVGYRIEYKGKAAAVATDMGCYNEYTVQHLKDLDVALVESNHDVNMLEVGPYPYPLKRRIMSEKGHLSNEACGHLLTEILSPRMNTVYLGHLSKNNNYEALAYATVTCEIDAAEECEVRSKDLPILVADRDHPMDMVTV